MAPNRFANVTRWSLYLLIASIGLGALLAIGIVIGGDWSWPQVRILLTAVTLATASIFGMACGAAAARAGSALPAVGIVITVVAAFLVIVGMWAEIGNADYIKATASVSIFAAASAHAALLSLARLAPSHQWIQFTAYFVTFLFGTFLTAIIFGSSSGDALRPLAVVGIVDAALSLLVPIVHLLDRSRIAAATAVGGDTVATMTTDGRPVALTELDAEIERLQKRLADLMEARSRQP